VLLNRNLIRRRRARGDDGVALVEAALVTPLVFTVLFGIMEFSWMLKDRMSVANAAHDAAREVSASATDGQADFQALRAARRSLSALDGKVDYIVIFKANAANGAGSQVPNACTTAAAIAAGGVSGVCNVYAGTDLAAPSTSFGYSPITPNPLLLDRFHPPRNRNDSRRAREFVGVHVAFTYRPLTGLTNRTRQLTATTVMPIEARRA
jgi:Flp pilus assembly protein TadG